VIPRLLCPSSRWITINGRVLSHEPRFRNRPQAIARPVVRPVLLCANSSGRPLRLGHVEEFQGRPTISLVRSLRCGVMLARRECQRGRERLRTMTLIILSVAAVATTLPCLFVWVADTARRPDRA